MMLKERMPGEEEREVVGPYFEAIINKVSAATTEGKKTFDPSSKKQLEEGWRDRYFLRELGHAKSSAPHAHIRVGNH